MDDIIPPKENQAFDMYELINAVVDERKDPVLSTLAAARYLHNSKQRLGSWGAAITAYNYGTNGMERAVHRLGTSDLETILREHTSKSFGFAAKNYYAEFLASLDGGLTVGDDNIVDFAPDHSVG